MKEDRVYLLHVADAIGQILEYTADGKDAFLADRKTQDAVVRNLQIVGEAVKRLSPGCARLTPTCPGSESPGCETR
jgi:uncharacterized protein with HEPN domain